MTVAEYETTFKLSRFAVKLVLREEFCSKWFERGLHPLIKETVIGKRIRVYSELVMVLSQSRGVPGHLLGCWGSPGVKWWVLLPRLIEGRKGADSLSGSASQSHRGSMSDSTIQSFSSGHRKPDCPQLQSTCYRCGQVDRFYQPLSIHIMPTGKEYRSHQTAPSTQGSIVASAAMVALTGQPHKTPGGVQKGRAYAMWEWCGFMCKWC